MMPRRSLFASVMCFCLVSFSCCALAQSGSGTSAASKVLVINPTLSKANLKNFYVIKGTVLRFEGTLADDVELCDVVLRSSGVVLASARGGRLWKLNWDTTDETRSARSLILSVTRANGLSLINASYFVQILDKPPFTVKATPPVDPRKDPLTIVITPTGGLNATEFTVRLSDKTVKADFAGNMAKIDVSQALPGNVPLVVTARVDNSVLQLDPVTVDIPSKARIMDVSSSLFSSVSVVPLHVKVDAGLKIKNVEFFLDGESIGSSDQAPFDSVMLSKAQLGSRAHILHANVSTMDDEHYLTPGIALKVMPRRVVASTTLGGDFLRAWGRRTGARSGVFQPR